jgi:hypothetical protein
LLNGKVYSLFPDTAFWTSLIISSDTAFPTISTETKERLSYKAAAIALPPLFPISFQRRSKLLNELLLRIMLAIMFAPVYPILLFLKSTWVIEWFVLSKLNKLSNPETSAPPSLFHSRFTDLIWKFYFKASKISTNPFDVILLPFLLNNKLIRFIIIYVDAFKNK